MEMHPLWGAELTELTEIENHRRLISAQIKREIAKANETLKKDFQHKINNLDSRLQEQQKMINVITDRLMQLSLYENKLILESNKLRKLIKD